MGRSRGTLVRWFLKAPLWQDPVPTVDHELIGDQDIAALKTKILASGLTISRTGHDCLGVGGNLPRLRQARWRERGTPPPRATKGLGSEPAGRTHEGACQAGVDPKGFQRFIGRSGNKGKKVSLADLIVLGGCAAVEEAAKKAGHDVTVPLLAGTHRCLARADRCALLRPARTHRRRVPQLPRDGQHRTPRSS